MDAEDILGYELKYRFDVKSEKVVGGAVFIGHLKIYNGIKVR